MISMIVKGNSEQALDACAKRGIAALIVRETSHGETMLRGSEHDAPRIAGWFIEARDGAPYPAGTLLRGFFSQARKG